MFLQNAISKTVKPLGTFSTQRTTSFAGCSNTLPPSFKRFSESPSLLSQGINGFKKEEPKTVPLRKSQGHANNFGESEYDSNVSDPSDDEDETATLTLDEDEAEESSGIEEDYEEEDEEEEKKAGTNRSDDLGSSDSEFSEDEDEAGTTDKEFIASDDEEESNEESSDDEATTYNSDLSSDEEPDNIELGDDDDDDDDDKRITILEDDKIRRFFKLQAVCHTSLAGAFSVQNIFNFIFFSCIQHLVKLHDDAIPSKEARIRALKAIHGGAKLNNMEENNVVRAFYIWYIVRDTVKAFLFSDTEKCKEFSEVLSSPHTDSTVVVNTLNHSTKHTCMFCGKKGMYAVTLRNVSTKTNYCAFFCETNCKHGAKMFDFLRVWFFPEICEHHIKDVFLDDWNDAVKRDMDQYKRRVLFREILSLPSYQFLYDIYGTNICSLLYHCDLASSITSDIRIF